MLPVETYHQPIVCNFRTGLEDDLCSTWCQFDNGAVCNCYCSIRGGVRHRRVRNLGIHSIPPMLLEDNTLCRRSKISRASAPYYARTYGTSSWS